MDDFYIVAPSHWAELEKAHSAVRGQASVTMHKYGRTTVHPYRFFVTHKNKLLENMSPEDGWSVCGMNERYAFILNGQPGAWSMKEFSQNPDSVITCVDGNLWFLAAPYSIADQPLYRLLPRPDFELHDAQAVEFAGKSCVSVQVSYGAETDDYMYDATLILCPSEHWAIQMVVLNQRLSLANSAERREQFGVQTRTYRVKYGTADVGGAKAIQTVSCEFRWPGRDRDFTDDVVIESYTHATPDDVNVSLAAFGLPELDYSNTDGSRSYMFSYVLLAGAAVCFACAALRALTRRMSARSAFVRTGEVW